MPPRQNVLMVGRRAAASLLVELLFQNASSADGVVRDGTTRRYRRDCARFSRASSPGGRGCAPSSCGSSARRVRQAASIRRAELRGAGDEKDVSGYGGSASCRPAEGTRDVPMHDGFPLTAPAGRSTRDIRSSRAARSPGSTTCERKHSAWLRAAPTRRPGVDHREAESWTAYGLAGADGASRAAYVPPLRQSAQAHPRENVLPQSQRVRGEGRSRRPGSAPRAHRRARGEARGRARAHTEWSAVERDASNFRRTTNAESHHGRAGPKGEVTNSRELSARRVLDDS